MYDNFSQFYDSLTDDVDYKRRAEWLYTLFEKYDRAPTLMLDLACGTGGFSNEFQSRGIQVIGVDISEDMLSVAREQSAKRGLDVLYLCQDACELDLFGTVDGAICCLDSLNHITDYSDFSTAVAKVSLFLEPERLFIFDVNTVYKQCEILGNNTFVLEEENVYCVWSNEFDSETNITDIFLDFFRKQTDGRYTRSQESFCERAYTDAEIRKALDSNGLEVITVLAELSDNSPAEDTQRAVYVTRKK